MTSFVSVTPDVCALRGLTDNKMLDIQTLSLFLCAKYSNLNCRPAFKSAGKRNIPFNVKTDGVSVSAYFLDNWSRRLLLATFSACFVHYFHYDFLAGHTGECCWYDSMTKEDYWTRMTKSLYNIVRDGRYCAQNCTHRKKQWKLKLYSLDNPVKYIGINTYRPLPKPKQDNR